MNGTTATATQPANDRHVLAYLKTVLAKLGGHIDEEALRIYVHIADEQAQVSMRQLAERREADQARAAGKGPRRAGRDAGNVGADARAKPARERQGVSKVSAKSWRSNMTRCSKSLGFWLEKHACSIRRYPTSGEGGIRTRGPAFDRTRL